MTDTSKPEWLPILEALKDSRIVNDGCVVQVWSPVYIGPTQAIYHTPWYRKYLPNHMKERGSCWKAVSPIIGQTTWFVDGLVVFALVGNREPEYFMHLPSPPNTGGE